MRKIRWLLIFPVVRMTLAFFGCQVQASDEIDFGGITNSVYQNLYFRLSVAFPPDWNALDQAAQRQIEADGAKAMHRSDQNEPADGKASELKSVHMFSVFKYPLGSPVPFNPSISAVAEDMRYHPDAKTSEDFLRGVKSQLESGQIQISFPKPDYSVKLDGIDFDVMPVEITFHKVTAEEQYYTTIIKGYALSFVLTYQTDKQKASLQKILDSMKFKPAN